MEILWLYIILFLILAGILMFMINNQCRIKEEEKVTKWTQKDIPQQKDKIVLITGATGGIGFETALYFVQAGATVIVAGRNETKGKDALERIKLICPNGQAIFGKVDLCSLGSIAEFCTWVRSRYQILDILINNAGVTTKERELTEDGFEMMVGTNHLSHFALTAQLLPSLRKSTNPRVVNISSLAAHFGKINFENFQQNQKFNSSRGYGASKLMNLLFTFELQRKSDAGGWGLTVNASHPGGSKTEGYARQQVGLNAFVKWILAHISHTAKDGAICTMYASTSPRASKNCYYGPQNMFGFTGPVGMSRIPGSAKNVEVAKKLWKVSETLTKVTWPAEEKYN